MQSFSVIIPSRDRSDMLDTAVTSVLEQEGPGINFEVVVVIDGEDQTYNLAPDSRLKVIVQPHKGVSAARNLGIKKTSNPLIAFLDDDDYWLPGKLQAQAEFFSENPEAAAVQTEEIWIRKGKRVNAKNYHKQPDGEILPDSLYRCLVSPSSVCIHRSVLDDIGLFDEELQACEDYDLWLRLGLKYKVNLIKKALIVKQGGREDQLSSDWGLDRWRIQSLQKFLKMELPVVIRNEAEKVLVDKCNIFAGGCRKHGRSNEAVRYENIALEISEATSAS